MRSTVDSFTFLDIKFKILEVSDGLRCKMSMMNGCPTIPTPEELVNYVGFELSGEYRAWEPLGPRAGRCWNQGV